MVGQQRVETAATREQRLVMSEMLEGLSDEVCVVLVTDSALVAGKGRHDYQLHL